jgi:hypothetical protein
VVIWPLSQWAILSIPSTFDQKALSSAAGQAPASGKSAQDVAAGVPIRPSSPVAPLAFGFVGAVPVTLLQRKLRTVARRRVRG